MDMDQRTRMWKTLGCLAIAMIGTSVLLGWMDPLSVGEMRVASNAEIASLVQQAVRSDTSVEIDARRWHEVEIARRHEPSANTALPIANAALPSVRGSLLAATASTANAALPSVDYHFYVDRFGRTLRTANWRNQKTVAESAGVIRIEVAAPIGDEPFSAAQRYCIESLAQTLSETIGSDRLTIRWAEQWEPT